MIAYQVLTPTSTVALKLLASETKAAARPMGVRPYVEMISESLLFLARNPWESTIMRFMTTMFAILSPKDATSSAALKMRTERALSQTTHMRQSTMASLNVICTIMTM